MSARVVFAKPEHIDWIAPRMRRADVDEVRAASGKSPREALGFSLDRSNEAYTALFNDVPAAMFGVGWINIINGIGAPWLLGTDEVEKNYRHFLRGSKWWIGRLSSRYDLLTNVVHAENRVSIGWLKFLGAEFSDIPIIIGHGEVFRRFEFRAKPTLTGV